MFFNFAYSIRTPIIFLMIFIVFSCSAKQEKKSNFKSKNNFLAYYNTYFMAEKNFNDALEIIQSNINQDKAVMQQADKLLDLAIENALIIEDEFFETKYLDDAYYILGMSSFYKNRMTAAKFYFNRIINEFSDSDTEYINKTEIWLSFIDLKTNNLDMLNTKINQIDLTLLEEDELFLYHRLLAEFFLYKEDYLNVEKQYIESLKYSSNRIDKLYIYNKLLHVSEIQKQYSNSVNYIDNIKIYSENNQLTDEMFNKWIDYNIKINNMKIVLNKLDELIDITPSKKKNIDYKIEQVNIYMKIKEYDKCKDMLDLLISENIENKVFKNELAHFYYLFAEIMVNENNYSEAQRYYDLSVNASATSEYGKISKNKNQSLIKYSNLTEEISFIRSQASGQDSVVDSLSQGIDSLIYSIGEILYFDFNQLDSSSYKFKKIIYDYPRSNFRYKSLIFMDFLDPDTTWNSILVNEYPEYINSNQIQEDPLSKERDEAWEMLSNSKEEAINKFLNIYNEKNDSKSLYSLAFIYDYYLGDIQNAMKYYYLYIDSYTNKEIFYNESLNRYTEIKLKYENEIESLNQKLNYTLGFRWIKEYLNIDSSLFYLDKAKNGPNKNFRSKSKKLIKNIEEFEQNLEILYQKESVDSANVNIDSITYNIAVFKRNKLVLDSLSIIDYKNIVSNKINTEFDNIAFAALSSLEPDQNWDSLLHINVPDTIKYNVLVRNESKKDIEKVPTVTLKNFSGGEDSLLDLLKNQAGLISFWDYSCNICRNELIEILQKFNKQNFNIVSININKENSIEFNEVKLLSEKYNFKILSDYKSLLFEKIGGFGKLETFIFFIDQDYNVIIKEKYNIQNIAALEEDIELFINNNFSIPNNKDISGDNIFDFQHEAFKESIADQFFDINLIYSFSQDSLDLKWLENVYSTFSINENIEIIDSPKIETDIFNNMENEKIDINSLNNLKNMIDTTKINFDMNKGILPNSMILDSSKAKGQKGE